MGKFIVPRHLTYRDAHGRSASASEDDLLQFTQPLVVLGEAGMGKSTLLKQLANRAGQRGLLVTARRLAASLDADALLGQAQLIIIDALDEVAGTREGEAVDRVLARLQNVGNPQFVLACRVADWRTATGVGAITDAYGEAPIEARLEALSSEDARLLLAKSVGDERAEMVVQHFEDRGLADLFGNPQTLELIKDIANKPELPDTRADLFAEAVEVMWPEHSDLKQDRSLAKLGKDAVLSAAGAGFATLILGGKESLTGGVRAKLSPDDLHLGDVPDSRLHDVVESRLFRPTERGFTYVHRSIGEYLGARWLSSRAKTNRTRRRLLTLFHHEGLVPAHLRGLHAWLAQSPALASEVIARDPMGVIEYGDADNLSPTHAGQLLDALIALDRTNPSFGGWGRYRANSLLSATLRDRVSELLVDPTTGHALRRLLLQVIRSSGRGDAFAPILRDIVLDEQQYYGARRLAGDALSAVDLVDDWPDLIEILRQQSSGDALRLATELLGVVGFDRFNDQQIAEVVAAETGLTLCPIPFGNDGRVLGTLFALENDLPDTRLDGVLDCLADFARDLLRLEDGYLERSEITDVVFTLVARRIDQPNLDPLRLWSWLEPFEGEIGYHRPPKDQLAEWFRRNPETRRAIQRHVLLERSSDKDIWERRWRLARAFSGLSPDETDVIELLALLGTPADPSSDSEERWKGIVQLVPHDVERGKTVRDAAMAFAGNRQDLREWLFRIAEPEIPEWQVRQEENRAKTEKEKQERWAEHRAEFKQDAAKLRSGDYGALVSPAKAYLKLFCDMGDDVPAHERVEEWLGADLAADASRGFEAFLVAEPPKPTANDIAESHAQSRRWPAEYIIVAALAERIRTVDQPFSDLEDERLLAGALILQQTRLDNHAGIEGVGEAIIAELKARAGQWEAFWRLQVEPQLIARRDHVDGLYSLMRARDDRDLASRLAAEWLANYPEMAANPESEMIDRLLRSDDYSALVELASKRRSMLKDNDERRQTWDATAFIVDFDNVAEALEDAGSREPNLLWHIRNRLGRHGDEDDVRIELSPAQLAWIVHKFRNVWSDESRPSRVTTGDTNVWDASEFIHGSIIRLGRDTSDAAVQALTALREGGPDSYTRALAIVSAEQAQRRAEEFYTAPTPQEIASVIEDQDPRSMADLSAIVWEELDVLRGRAAGFETDLWRFFWSGTQPRDENASRDLVVELLGPNLPFGIVAATEVDMPADKRADIGFSHGQLRLPIEVKCHWHPQLWTAADSQLQRLYGLDYRSRGAGIYVVLWFGSSSKKQMPKRPGGRPQPTTATELADALAEESAAAKSGAISIVVLDVSRRDC